MVSPMSAGARSTSDPASIDNTPASPPPYSLVIAPMRRASVNRMPSNPMSLRSTSVMKYGDMVAGSRSSGRTLGTAT